MSKIQTVVAFAILAITLTIITLPIWLDSALPQIFSIMSIIKALPGEIGSILSSFVEFVKHQI